MKEKRIYLDFDASTPIGPEVVEAMRPFLTEHYGCAGPEQPHVGLFRVIGVVAEQGNE